MEQQVSVSVVIPCYNGKKYVARCISALKAQSLTDFEVIVVDDGSQDGSAAAVETSVAGDPRVTLYRKENEGPVVARDYGMKRAKGKYLTFCDIDDYLPTGGLQDLFETAEKEQADIVAGAFLMEYPSGKRTLRKVMEFSALPGQEYVKLLLSGRAGWQMWGKLFRRSLVEEHHIEAPAHVVIGDDATFTLQVALYARRVTSFCQPVYVYMQNAGSLMRNGSQKPYHRYFEAAKYLESKSYGDLYADSLSAFWLLSLSSASRIYGLSLPRSFVRQLASWHFTYRAIRQIPFVKRCYIALYILMASAFGKK